MVAPMITVRIGVQNRLAKGSISANGTAPRIEPCITALRPMRSLTGPLIKVPTATAARKMNR